jgi:hypothetical protein
VFFHGTSRADKLWPDAHWRRLIEMFATSAFPSFCLGKRRRARAERALRRGVPLRTFRQPPRPSLPALAALLARAELVIGVDTGSCISPRRSARRPCRCSSRPILDAAASASPVQWARDLGGIGAVPTPEMVERAAAELMRRTPRC